jgi:succinate dehydrogenase/fumarate reductase flavoprotein subunit
VTRPGGAALNAGQVFGLRCAKHIAATPRVYRTPFCPRNGRTLQQIQHDSSHPQALRIDDIRDEIQQRMSERAGFVCDAAQVPAPFRRPVDSINVLRKMGWQ